MKVHHRILSCGYYPTKIIKSLGRPFGLSSQDNLRVLLYHDIPASDQARFAEQLRWLSKSWDFISVEKFSAMILGDEPIKGRNLLLTFDDGFASHRVVAEEVLNPMGIQALFFVVSDFVSLQNREDARNFISKNIQPGTPAKDLPETWANMNWTDLETLLEQGHTIGAHTKTHARLSNINIGKNLEEEIISCADILESNLGVSIEHFAYTFGDLASFSEEALLIAKRRFRFIYSGLRGDNSPSIFPYAIQRDSAATQDSRSNYSVFSNSLLGSFLEGAADFKYKRDWSTINIWGK
jgi:peptidoglycan/xylan/chitin deacetylase (PgdA/CDA1 family)